LNMANPFAKFAQPEVEQNPFARFAQPQEEAAPQKPQEDNSIWTDAADFGKKFLGSTISGFASIPKGGEEATKGAIRKAATGEVDVREPMPLLAGKVLARKVDELLRGKDKQAEDAVAVERTLAKIPEIPGATYLRDLGKQTQKSIEDSVSEQNRKAVQDAQITGNIFKGEIDFGKNPTVRGYVMQMASIFGSLAPVIATAVVTKSPTAGGVAGGTMAADEAATKAEEFIGKMSHEDLMKNSPFYGSLIKQGVSQAEAKDLTTRKAAESGAIMQGLVATFGDRFTAKLTTGALDDMLKKAAGKSVLGRTTAGTAIGMGEEGLQETTEGLAADIAIQNVVKNKEIGEDSAANLILGMLGGAPVGGVSGLKGALAEKFKDPNTTEQERETILDTLTRGMQEPADLFADQEGGQPAGQPGQESQVDLYAQRAADALESTNAIAGRGSPVSAKYGDVDQTLPPSDEPPGLFEDVESGAAVTSTPSAPGAPSAPATARTLEAYSDFVRQYTDLRDEYNSLPSGTIDQAGMNQRKLIQKDLAAVVDANMGLIRNKGVAAQLKNPVFDGSKVLARLEPSTGQPKAMQGGLFGLYQAAARRMRNAMALAQQDVNGAIAELEDNRARIQEKVDSGGFDDATIISMRPANMSSGQALKNRDSIVQNYLQTSNAEIDQAIDMLRRGVGQPRAMQGDLFNNEKIQQENADAMRERRAAPIVDESGAIVRSPIKGEPPIAAAGFKTLDEDNDFDENLTGATFITGMDIKGRTERNKGVGTRLLNAITNWADTNGKTLVLVAAASPDAELGGLSQEQLKAWYARNGFEDRVDYMVRVPTEEKTQETKPAEVVRKGVPPPAKFVRAPTTDTEHVVQTEEGGKIKGFFDSIQSASDSPAEQERHGNSKNTAADTMLEFDVVQPGETTSAGAQQMLDYLARRVGGQEKLNALLAALSNASPDGQSRLLANAGLPDLTTRRGMDEFSAQVQTYVDQMMASGEGALSNIRTSRMRPSQVTGTKIPYQETITTGATTTSTYATPVAGKPRRPSQNIKEIVRDINDNKLRAAALILKQMTGKISPQAQAAITYLTNRNRETFGDALRDLAFDLAYFEIDPKHYGANSTFYKEGGKYAQDFRAWIETNLDPATLELLDELVAENKQNAAESEKFAKAISEYNEKLDAVVEKERREAERNGAKLPKAPRRKKAKERLSQMQEEAETEAGEGEEVLSPTTQVNLQNLPTVEMLTEVHPSIRRLLEQGKTREALELLAQTKNNKYYAELAQRLLDTGFTAKTRLIEADALESLSNDPQITKSLNERLDTLRDLVVALYPQEQQASIISDLKSGKLRNLVFALDTIQDTLSSNKGTESNQQLLDSVIDLVNEEFAWDGKYDPASDTIVMRQGSGKLTNHLLLHETVHAASSYLIDNADSLVGVQRQGYDRLVELFEYSKNMMNQQGVTDNPFYGLQDLHEFVSEALTNPKLQAVLRSYRYKASSLSLWNRFTKSISDMFKVKPGAPSNVMVEVMFAADAMMAGTMSLQGMNEAGGTIAGPPKPRAMATKGPRRRTTVPKGLPNQPSTIRRWMMADTWTNGKMRELRSLNAGARKAYLGMLTLRQINDLVGGRIKQIGNFINVTEQFLAKKSQILKESGDISRKWERLQSADPDMSRQLGVVMHSATILEIDPDKATTAQRVNNAKLMNEWRALSPEARTIYREVRDFYERRYSNYKRLMNRRIVQMRQLGVSEATILEIRNEFEKGKRAGPYFPLMRFGRFWYQVGKGQNREYYMFESEAARDMHRDELLKQNPSLSATIGQNIGNNYQQQMDFHARESSFLKSAFAGVDSINMTGLTQAEADARRTELKDNLYQTYLANQPDRSMRNAFVHRNSIAGYSEDALRSFSASSFNMAYQMSRFEYSPEMFSQLDAARSQIKGRFSPGAAFDPALVRENDELRDYVDEIDKRLGEILNPTDTGKYVSGLSNIGFIYYLTSIGSALVNVMGGAMIGVPTLIGQQVRSNPKMGYTEATARVLYNTSKTMAQIIATGFDIEGGGRVIDSKLLSPSLDRSKTMSAVDRAAYNRFVADGLIDITAAYDQSGLASNPTSEYNSIPNRAMQVVAYAFHHAERFNREIIAMSAFRSAMEKRANYTDRQKAFAESVAEAKDLTNRSMFDYSAPNKPRFLQSSAARVILQFKQFPQQMTFFLARNAWNTIGKLPEAEKREARARFVGTMGMAGIFSGVTGLWGFSTVAFIVEAVAQMTAGDDDEPFDFELEFTDWAVNTFGKNMGTMVSRGIGNAAGVDLHSRLKLDGMWFRDGRNNLDAEAQVEAFLVGILGPTVGLLPTAARAVDLYKTGHADRAIETMLPGFAKQPVIAARYAQEGARTLQGELMKKDFTPFELMIQSLGIRPADLAEIQFRNIKVKGQEQAILKKRDNILNIFALTFMTNDVDGNKKAFDKIMEFNKKYPTMAIKADGMIKSISNKLEKSVQTDHGLYIDPKLRYLFKDTYIQKLTQKEEPPKADYKSMAKQYGGELVEE